MSTITAVVEQIETEARTLRPGRVALTLLAAPFFVLGWLVGQAARLIWVVVAWLWTASVVGYRAARPDTRRT